MKLFGISILFLLALRGFSRPIPANNAYLPDTALSENFRISGSLLLTSNAFAPIPAFSLDYPALMGFCSVSKHKFLYETDFSLGLNGMPWMWNNWFRYNLLANGKFTLGIGLNPSLFFKSEMLNSNGEIISSHRNITGELSGKYLSSKGLSILLTYRYNHAFDNGTIHGHYLGLSSDPFKLIHYKKSFVNVKPQLFYFNNNGPVDGFFTSISFSYGVDKLPVLFSYQAVQLLWVNYPVRQRYNSNLSLIYIF